MFCNTLFTKKAFKQGEPEFVIHRCQNFQTLASAAHQHQHQHPPPADEDGDDGCVEVQEEVRLPQDEVLAHHQQQQAQDVGGRVLRAQPRRLLAARPHCELSPSRVDVF